MELTTGHPLDENNPTGSPATKLTEALMVSMIRTGIRFFFSSWSSLDSVAKEVFKNGTTVMKIGKV